MMMMMMMIMYYIDGWIEDEVNAIMKIYSLFSMITGKNTMLTQQRPSPIHLIPARRLHHHPSPSILNSKTPPQKKKDLLTRPKNPRTPPFCPLFAPFSPLSPKNRKKGRRPKNENNQSTHPAAATTTAPPTAAASPSARGPISPATH